MPIEEKRYQCWVDLINLNPDTTYYAMAFMNDINGKELKFRTGPLDNEFTFISGGDLSWNNYSIPILKYLSQKEPLFAIVGGDISYDNGDPFCYRVWDLWFKNWDLYMKTPNNYSIPILTAIGNHEAGGFMQDRYYNTFSIRIFPHQTNLTLIDPNLRNTYHQHILSNNAAIIVLDSWAHSNPKDQKDWLNNILSKMNQIRNKFAVYHASIYPWRVIQDNQIEKPIIDSMKINWLPLFDQYQMTAVFENHIHAYKKTFPLRNGTRNIPGTLYLGDGQMGVGGTSAPFSGNPLIQEGGLFSHYYVIKPSFNITKFSVVREPLIELPEFTN